MGLAAALLSNQYYWWIDAVGAMVLALYTITNWGKSVIENAGINLFFVTCLFVFCQQGFPCHHVWLFRSVVKLVNLSTSLLGSDSMLEISGPSKY